MGLSENVGENPSPYSDLSQLSIISYKKCPQMAGYIHYFQRDISDTRISIVFPLYPTCIPRKWLKMIASTLILCHTYITIPLGALKTRLCRGCALWMRCPNSGNVWPLRPQVGLVPEIGKYVKSFIVLVGHVWGHVWPPKKWPWSSPPCEVTWHRSLVHFNQRYCSSHMFSWEAILLTSAIFLTRNFCGNCKTVLRQKNEQKDLEKNG